MKDEDVKNISYIKLSKHRQKVLIALSNHKMKLPSEISKETKMPLSDVSRALRGLKDKNFVECLNEEDVQGRLYKSTEKGKKILEYL